jgi:hypothetical protein
VSFQVIVSTSAWVPRAVFGLHAHVPLVSLRHTWGSACGLYYLGGPLDETQASEGVVPAALGSTVAFCESALERVGLEVDSLMAGH